MCKNVHKCGELKLYFSSEIILTTTIIVVGSTPINNKIIRVLIKPKSNSLSTTSVHNNSKSIHLLLFCLYG